MSLLEDNLANKFLHEPFKPGSTVVVDLDDEGKVKIFVNKS